MDHDLRPEDWFHAYRRRMRQLRVRNGVVFASMFSIGAQRVGWVEAVAVSAGTLVVIYAAIWGQVWLARRRAVSGAMPCSVVTRASGLALTRLAISGYGQIRAAHVDFVGGTLRRDDTDRGWIWVPSVRLDPPEQRLHLTDDQVTSVRYQRWRGGWLPESGLLEFHLANGETLPMITWDARKVAQIRLAAA